MVGSIDESGEIAAIQSHLVSLSVVSTIGEQLDGIFQSLSPRRCGVSCTYASTGYLSDTSLMGFFEGGEIAT